MLHSAEDDCTLSRCLFRRVILRNEKFDIASSLHGQVRRPSFSSIRVLERPSRSRNLGARDVVPVIRSASVRSQSAGCRSHRCPLFRGCGPHWLFRCDRCTLGKIEARKDD